jgi:uncharacterized protein YcbK (DUF882 family)
MSLFEHIEGFGQNENWGNSHKMSGFTVLMIEKVRMVYRKRYDPAATFVIHCGYDLTGHATDSQHYKGNAIDFHIVTTLSFREQVNAMKQIMAELQILDMVGLGIYPQWAHPGFHIDSRGQIARWGQIDGKYVGLDAALDNDSEIA